MSLKYAKFIYILEGGIQEFEVNLIRLIDKLTNGTKIRLSPCGTEIEFIPGILYGGKLEHDCCVEKSIGYYLDVLIAFGPFCKFPIDANLKGVTNSNDNPSVDHIKSSAFNILKRFIVENDSFDLKVIKRGLKPNGGGEIHFRMNCVKKLKNVQISQCGMVKRVRGIVYACKVSPTFANRTVESGKGVLLNFIPDVYINTDQLKGKNSGLSPGFGINMQAETNEGVTFSVECISTNHDRDTLPEDIGKECANKLLDEIYRSGCCDSTFQWIMILFMALGPKSVSKVVVGTLSAYSIRFLQLIREFFGITFKLDKFNDEDNLDDEENVNEGSPRVVLTCVGLGYSNITKMAF